MASDKITFKCRRCGGTQFKFPSATPKATDIISCAGCGASARYGDVQAEAVTLAKQEVEKAFKRVKNIKLKF